MILRANTKAIHGGQGHEVRAGASIAIIVKLHELVKEHICMPLWVSKLFADMLFAQPDLLPCSRLPKAGSLQGEACTWVHI